jgi:hypothetical protein
MGRHILNSSTDIILDACNTANLIINLVVLCCRRCTKKAISWEYMSRKINIRIKHAPFLCSRLFFERKEMKIFGWHIHVFQCSDNTFTFVSILTHAETAWRTEQHISQRTWRRRTNNNESIFRVSVGVGTPSLHRHPHPQLPMLYEHFYNIDLFNNTSDCYIHSS